VLSWRGPRMVYLDCNGEILLLVLNLKDEGIGHK
jgi:hypothetical protein